MGCGNNCGSCIFNGNCDLQDAYDYEETDEYGNRHGVDDDDDDEYGY